MSILLSPQVIAATFLSGLATSAWTPLAQTHGVTFTAVAVAVATARASAMVARPALATLLSVALGPSLAGGGGGGGGGNSCNVNDGYNKSRRGGRALLSAAIGVSQAIGVLAAGVAFARAVNVGADAGVVCFRIAAVAFVGVYLATLFVHATEGVGAASGGRGGGALRGANGGWLATCDFVEQAMSARASARGVGGGMAGGGAVGGWGGGGMAKES